MKFTCISVALVLGCQSGIGQAPGNVAPGNGQPGLIKQAKRRAARVAAASAAPHAKRVTKQFAGINASTATLSPLSKGAGFAPMAALQSGPPDYFAVGNYANSPLPTIGINGTITGGMRKFVDMLPGLCGLSPWKAAGQTVAGTNGLGQCLPLATADTTSFPGSDYYHIGIRTYSQKMHSDIPVPTPLMGYTDLNTASPVSQYLGPFILATRNRPVRVLFENRFTAADNYTIPVDTTYLGAGLVNGTANGVPTSKMASLKRAVIHLHGGNTPWISDGTPHQWVTPPGGDGQPSAPGFSKGYSFANVPDMVGTASSPIPSPTLADGKGTYYWTNQQSGRLMFYHEHAYGTTRTGVYGGVAAGYLIVDPAQETALQAATVPGTIITNPATGAILSADANHLIPLVIQDKTFVPDDIPGGQLAAQDPTWDLNWGHAGSLWFPHVYMPNQNPADISAANGFGRWDYGPWFWPPQNPATFVPGGQPYPCTSAIYSVTPPAFPPLTCPGTPLPSGTPEAFMDTPVVNGTAYPTITVDPTAYRFQILNAANDRSFNLQLYQAQPLTIGVASGGSGYTAPVVNITGGGGSGAAATAVVAGGSVTALALGTNGGGSGYTSAPTVTIAAPAAGGVTATANAILTGGTVTGFDITNPGSGYLVAPAVTITGGGGSGATAVATVASPGVIVAVNVTNAGTGYTSAPQVTVTDPTGTGAVFTAAVNSEVAMVPATPPAPGMACTTAVPITNPGLSVGLATALLDGSGNPLNNTGLPANCWPSTWPTDGRDGGVPDPKTAGPPIIEIGSEGGVLPKPAVIPSTPVNYEYGRRSITVTNVSTHALLIGPAERADVVIDFTKFAGKTLLVYNDSPAPIPAFDPRIDYYTGDVDNSPTGGAPTTLPGYGPNTRTIMQINVASTAANPLPTTPFSLTALKAALPNIFSTAQDKVIVPETFYPAANGGSATNTYVRIQDTSLTGFTGGPIGSLTLTSGGSGYTSAPAVTISAPSIPGGVNATATATIAPAGVGTVTLKTAGSYTVPPTVVFTGGGGTGAAATAVLTGTRVGSLALTANGTGYTAPPSVVFSGGGGSGASANTTLAPTVVGTLSLGSGGSGYTAAPSVVFTGGGGSGASGRASLTPTTVSTIKVTAGGSGYTSAPVVFISGGGGTGATANAVLSSTSVATATMLNQGSGYTSVPAVTITGNGCTGVTATATVARLVVTGVTITNGGSGCTGIPTVAFTGGGGTGAAARAVLAGTSVASVTVVNPGSGYTSAPAISFSAGGGTGAAAAASLTPTSVASVTLLSGGSGYTSVPAVSLAGTGSGATASATLVASTVGGITLISGGTGYTSVPTVALTGGNGSGATATASLVAAPLATVNVTAAGSGYSAAPAVSFTGGAGSGATATAALAGSSVVSLILTNAGTGYGVAPTVTIAAPPLGTTATASASAPVNPILPKAIQELFTLDYGRMNATLGVELPFTNFTTQTTIPYGYADPPTEMFKPGETQLWKITHNGVDTHFIHFHLFTVQVINRVGWDGSMRPPEENEIGFKDTVRMNPLEDIIVALRPFNQTLPWSVPNSYRPMLVTQPVGFTSPYIFTNVDPNNNPGNVVNDIVNFGWEYVWHCHILGHEENDMMRAMVLAVAPPAPALTATRVAGPPQSVLVNVSDTGLNITGFTIQRATSLAGPWTTVGTVPANVTAGGATATYSDTTVAPGTTYYYRAIGNNLVGYTTVAGYPNQSADSTPSAVSAPVTTL